MALSNRFLRGNATQALIAILVATLASPTMAADKKGRFRVKGAGSSTCQHFSEAVREAGSEFVSYGGWLDGYLTAMNRYEDETYDVVSWQSTELLLASLLRYRQTNPEAIFHSAAAQLAQTLKRWAIRAQNPIQIAESDGMAAAVYKETLARVQGRLRQQGFYDGDLSGEFDEVTRDALKAFQESKAIHATGLPDQETLMRLLSSRPAN